MKLKLLCVVLVCACLVGCGQEQPEFKSFSNMSFTVDIVYEKDNYKCNGTIKDSALTLQMTEPASLKGLMISFNDTEVLIQHLGLKESILIDNFPKSSPVMLLNSSISKVASSDLEASDKSNYIARGEIEDEKFEFILSPAMLPISVEIQGLNFKANFSNVTIEKCP